MSKVRNFLEHNIFGVCTRIGEKMGISISSVRLYFIYLSFLTFGSPIFVYLVLAFWINFRRYLRWNKQSVVRDL
jgi:phage shock protein C